MHNVSYSIDTIGFHVVISYCFEMLLKDLYVLQALVTALIPVRELVPNQDTEDNKPPTSCWQQIGKNLVPILCSAWVIAIIAVLCVFLSTHCKYTISIVSTDQILCVHCINTTPCTNTSLLSLSITISPLYHSSI